MPRRKRCRRISGYPDYWSFGPEGPAAPETVTLQLDEYEAIRLIDYEKKTQEECASVMGVSRATVTSIYENARFKLADAMVNGKRVRITGGSYRIDSIPASSALRQKTEGERRIAAAYDEGRISRHFGRTEQFKIYDVLDGEVRFVQVIDTNGIGHSALAGFLRAAEVETLICGGIGMGARNALREVGIQLIPGVRLSADEAIEQYLNHSLEYDPDSTCKRADPECGCPEKTMGPSGE